MQFKVSNIFTIIKTWQWFLHFLNLHNYYFSSWTKITNHSIHSNWITNTVKRIQLIMEWNQVILLVLKQISGNVRDKARYHHHHNIALKLYENQSSHQESSWTYVDNLTISFPLQYSWSHSASMALGNSLTWIVHHVCKQHPAYIPAVDTWW